ncbi:MAG: small multi-drug export protein [Methanoregula sp.]|nr:small multi-drug export protein [Methanoregula sp.]
MVNSITESILARGVPYRAIALLIPVLVVIIHISIMAATLPQAQFFTMLGLIAAYLLPPAGKETVIPIGIALGIPWWYMALSIVMIDVETGLFMALNFDLAYRIPYLGPLLSNLTKKTEQFITEHHWLAGLWFFAIVLMVMVPVLGSGGIRGSIAGKILGINNVLVFFAILVGSLIGCFGIALGSDAILTHLCVNGTLPAEIGARVCGGG